MILNIARKELKSVFSTPMGWVILSLILFVFGYYYYEGVDQYFQVMSGSMRPEERKGVTEFVGQNLFGIGSFVMLFAVPLLTMRLISEERRNQTLAFLFSAPLSLTEIVVGKFVGLVAFLSILIIFVFLMMASLSIWAEIDYGYIFANLIGLWLLLASFAALGIYVSSLTQQPVIAAIITFIVLFGLLMLDNLLAASQNEGLAYVSLMRHFQPFSRGLINTGDIAYFILFITTFLTLTIRRLDADRLRG